jgi:alkaline phosphatase D
MPVFPLGRTQIYRTPRHGRTVELLMLDERQCRDNQPCNDRIALPCGSWDRPRSMLGRRQREFLERRLSASDAAWKVIGGQSLMMPNRVHDGEYTRFDSWQGYPQEREHVLQHIAQNGIKDVVFLSGDTHTIVAGDVCTNIGAGPPVAAEFAAGSINVRDRGGGGVPHARPHGLGGQQRAAVHLARGGALPRAEPLVRAAGPRPPRLRDRLRSRTTFDVTLKRLWTVKMRNYGTMPDDGFRWRLKRGQTSIKGTAI